MTNRIFSLPCRKTIILCVGILTSLTVSAQQPNKKEALRINLNEDGSHFIKPGIVNQTWIRWNQSNPGSTLAGQATDNTFDIGLRRTRFTLTGQVTDRFTFFAQVGMNNFTAHSARKAGFFVHDIAGDYAVIIEKLSIGTGLTAYKGPLRYAVPSAGGIMSMDAPVYQQYSVDVNDLLGRLMMIYAKGKISHLDYRLSLGTPFTQSTSDTDTEVTEVSTFSETSTYPVIQGYFKWQFREHESNITAYQAGTYLGAKDVMNVGIGFASQKGAMQRLDGTDTLQSNLALAGIDFFLDHPFDKEKGNTLTVYGAFSYADYGKNYIRNVGVMNPNDGFNAQTGSFNGTGNSFPMMGTGTTSYVQIGYKLRNGFLGDQGTLQPYFCGQFNSFDALTDKVAVYNLGINWLVLGAKCKFTLDLQSRPIFDAAPDGSLTVSQRKLMVVLQHQFSF